MKILFTSVFTFITALVLQAQSFNFPANYNTNWPDVDNANFEEMNGEIYFFAAQDNFDYEPHKYNCATSTYIMLKDVNPGGTSSEPYSGVNEMMKFKTHVYFGALDGTGKTDLWRTDGSTTGTVKFKIFPYTSTDPQTITFFAADENLMYFRASNNSGYGVWRTDGTEAGTFLISQATNFNYYVSEKKEETLLYNGKFYFQQKLLPSVISLPFATDGTVAGTVGLTAAGNPDNYYMTDPYDFEPFQNSVWFGLDGPTGGGLFKSNGTLAGTQFMGSCGTGADAGYRPTNLKAAGNYLYVRATGTLGYELYYTDGTINGGGRISDIYPNGGSGLKIGSEMCSVGDKLFFTAWKSFDNSIYDVYMATGTSAPILLDISGPSNDSKPKSLVSYNNMLYFRATATGSSAVNRVYKSDGTVAGTVDAAPGANYIFESGKLYSLPSGLYFTARVAGNDFRPGTIGNCFLTTAVENKIENQLEIYPNPAQNHITIKGLEYNQKIWLVDVQGRKMLEKQVSSKVELLDLSSLPGGIYLLGFENGKRERIVKN